jgi:hypothetical protein
VTSCPHAAFEFVRVEQVDPAHDGAGSEKCARTEPSSAVEHGAFDPALLDERRQRPGHACDDQVTDVALRVERARDVHRHPLCAAAEQAVDQDRHLVRMVRPHVRRLVVPSVDSFVNAAAEDAPWPATGESAQCWVAPRSELPGRGLPLMSVGGV